MGPPKEKTLRQRIADRLNRLGLPCGSADTGSLGEGKRKRRMAKIWRPSHVRNLIVSRTYMGQHAYGKRSRSHRKPILRPVPAIVSEKVWQAARDG